jgi:hypothetical protein
MIQTSLQKYDSSIARLRRLWVRGEVKVAFYSSWLLFVFLVFGVLGSLDIVRKLQIKDNLIEQLTRVNADMGKNVLELQKADGLISNSKVNIGYFEKRMPNEKNEEAYLKEIYLTCIQSNYTLTGLSQVGVGINAAAAEAKIEDNEIKYFLKARGSTSPDNLIANLEKLQRVTYVRKVDFEEKNKIYTVNIELSAFYTKEAAL